MEILLYRLITLTSELDPEEIINRIDNSIENVGFQLFRYGVFSKPIVKPFEGETDGLIFKVQRAVNYRNGMLPMLYGNIIREFNVTSTYIKIIPSLSVRIFFNLYTLGGIVSTLFIFRKVNVEIEDFLPLGLIFFSLFSFANFWYESNCAIKELKLILDCKEDIS